MNLPEAKLSGYDKQGKSLYYNKRTDRGGVGASMTKVLKLGSVDDLQLNPLYGDGEVNLDSELETYIRTSIEEGGNSCLHF